MSLLTPLFNYCERAEPGLFAEPLNAASNIVFFIAAWLLWRRYEAGDRPRLLLIALVAIVGVGSALFHTFANGLTMLMDVLPIMFFVLCYLFIALRRLLSFSILHAALWLAILLMVAASTSQIPADWRFNGSVSYSPCLLALLLLAWRAKSSALLRAACIFAASLVLRSLDMALCPHLAIGTHFMWHLLNGWMLYVLVSALAINRCARR